jgi:hypothetical protein
MADIYEAVKRAHRLQEQIDCLDDPPEALVEASGAANDRLDRLWRDRPDLRERVEALADEDDPWRSAAAFAQLERDLADLEVLHGWFDGIAGELSDEQLHGLLEGYPPDGRSQF